MHDVVVVGAGPAGSASAALLARRGYRVLLVDRAHFPRPKTCAEYMSPGVADVLRRTDLVRGVEEAEPLAVAGMDIVSPRGARLRIQYERCGVPATATTLRRQELDSRLVAEAVAAGAELLEGCTVQSPVVEGGVVCGVQARRAGTSIRLVAPLTIAADGSASILASRLRLSVPARWPVRLGLVAHYERERDASYEYGEMHVSPGGYCGVAPLPGGLLNVAVVTDASALRRSRLTATEFLERWVQTRLPLRRLLEPAQRVTGVRGLLPLGARAHRGGVPGLLLAGDAAGFFDPFTGEGIFRALRSAELIDELLAQSPGGAVGPSEIARYDRMRRGAFRGKEAVTALVQLFVSRPMLMEYAVARLTSRPAPRRALSDVLGDVAPARDFLNPAMLVAALRP